MADLSRRNFFKLVAGAMAVPVAAKLALALPNIPVIWGDGIHNDAPGLNALIRGEVVEFQNAKLAAHVGWHGDSLVFGSGTFKINEPIVFEGLENKAFSYGTFMASSDFSGEAMFKMRDCSGVYCSNIGLDGSLAPEPASGIMMANSEIRGEYEPYARFEYLNVGPAARETLERKG